MTDTTPQELADLNAKLGPDWKLSDELAFQLNLIVSDAPDDAKRELAVALREWKRRYHGAAVRAPRLFREILDAVEEGCEL